VNLIEVRCWGVRWRLVGVYWNGVALRSNKRWKGIFSIDAEPSLRLAASDWICLWNYTYVHLNECWFSEIIINQQCSEAIYENASNISEDWNNRALQLTIQVTTCKLILLLSILIMIQFTCYMSTEVKCKASVVQISYLQSMKLRQNEFLTLQWLNEFLIYSSLAIKHNLSHTLSLLKLKKNELPTLQWLNELVSYVKLVTYLLLFCRSWGFYFD
jgi:hypothetical protein